ncbi:MAG: ABC transporter ATP-binding protein [Finegoldia sp.]|nr:ABC transporter ATP-binding protein [Finegoldia sp.]
MNGLKLQNISVSYGNNRILKNLNIEVAQGEFCGLLGLNGSGKTTLLHAICGFLPMNGECYVNGENCKSINERQRARKIAFIPQSCSLTGGIKAIEVVLMGYNPWLHILESPSVEQKKQALKIMEKLECKYLANKDFGELSQGQKQMVILARCMAQNSPVMLMDEPDSALDFLNKHLVLKKIKRVIKDENKIGLITMHDPNFAMEYCDRLFLLRDGEIVTQIHMKEDSYEKIKRSLSMIYGEIELLKNGTEYLMGKKQR